MADAGKRAAFPRTDRRLAGRVSRTAMAATQKREAILPGLVLADHRAISSGRSRRITGLADGTGRADVDAATLGGRRLVFRVSCFVVPDARDPKLETPN